MLESLFCATSVLYRFLSTVTLLPPEEMGRQPFEAPKMTLHMRIEEGDECGRTQEADNSTKQATARCDKDDNEDERQKTEAGRGTRRSASKGETRHRLPWCCTEQLHLRLDAPPSAASSPSSSSMLK